MTVIAAFEPQSTQIYAFLGFRVKPGMTKPSPE
jgi:hypothetical protein